MLIVGAKGFAKEILEDIHSMPGIDNNLYFYDDVSNNLPELLFGKYKIIRSRNDAKLIFETISQDFSLGLGGPDPRFKLTKLMEELGGALRSIISVNAKIGSFDNNIEVGVTIMAGAVLTNSIVIGKGTLINLNATVGHDSSIGMFCDISPAVNISGNCKIGNYCALGTGAVILPNITIGNNCVIGAGAVVTNDIPDNSLVVGVPGKIIKNLPTFGV